MSTEPMSPVVAALTGEAGMVADIIAEAFWHLDVAAWLVADPLARRRLLRAQFAIVVEHAVEYGSVDVLDDRSAVAVWFYNDAAAPTPPPRDYHRRLAAGCGSYTPRFRTLDALLAGQHPERRHHHLAFLAVLPAWQGTGRGCALLDHHHHKIMDAEGVGGYLEASSARSRDFYTRHGYQVGEAFRLPDGPAFWPMTRPPRPTRPARPRPDSGPGPAGFSSARNAEHGRRA